MFPNFLSTTCPYYFLKVKELYRSRELRSREWHD